MSDDRQEPPAGEHDDQTRPLPPTGDAAEPGDRTSRLPGPEGPAPGERPGDVTRPLPVDRTAPMDRTAALPPEPSGPAAWSGRAEVPPPRSADYRQQTEWYAEEPAGRRWWLPILWGVLVLLLLALLGVGLWLALRAAEDGDTGPEPSPSVSLTRASPTTGAPTTSAAPTTASPSVPTTTAAAPVPMPPVANLPLRTAQAILDRVGLDYRIEYRTSDRPDGTVISTEPEAGELVPEGEEVVLVVSRAEPSPSVTVTPSPEPSPTA